MSLGQVVFRTAILGWSVSGVVAPAASLDVCVALRGNGAKILATANAVARVLENLGPVDGVGGSSSGSVLAFLYESVRRNPALGQCGERPCTKAEIGSRAALALKSLQGYLESLGDLPEGQALQELKSGWTDLRGSVLRLLTERESQKRLTGASRTLLQSKLLRDLLHPSLYRILSLESLWNAPRVASRVRASVDTKTMFSGNDHELLLRPGFVNFPVLIDYIGRVGDFYADVGGRQTPAWRSFLDRCAPEARGRPWAELGPACKSAFAALVAAHRRLGPTDRSRLDDFVGESVTTLVSTSVLTGRSVVSDFRLATQEYARYRPASFRPGFASLRVGYFGSAASLDKLLSAPADPEDLMTQRRVSLGARTWRTALLHSTTEPGLSSALVYEGRPDTLTSGGWIHVDHAKAMKAVGCANVVFVTCSGEESPFPIRIARLIGARDADIEALYSLDRSRSTPSSFAKHLSASEGVVCTRWEQISDAQQKELIEDALKAPIEVRSDFLRKGDFASAPADIGVRGCSASLPD